MFVPRSRVHHEHQPPGLPQLCVVQWNLLADGLAAMRPDKGGFTHGLDPRFLDWSHRSELIWAHLKDLEADVLCFEECDHPEFLRDKLCPRGYSCFFKAKRQSPCLEFSTLEDGCFLAFKSSRFNLLGQHEFFLGDNANQCGILVALHDSHFNVKLIACVSHLKAAKDEQGELVRTRQTQVILHEIELMSTRLDIQNIIYCVDMNATPKSESYGLLLSAGFLSSYVSCMGCEPRFTTCKQRDKLVEMVIDYVFFKGSFVCQSVLDSPSEPAPLPTQHYPSDHLMLWVALSCCLD